MSDIIKIKEEYISKLNQDINLNQVNQFKTELFGKNGKISADVALSNVDLPQPEGPTNTMNSLS